MHEGVARAHRGFDNAAVRIVDSRTIELIERTGEKVIERESFTTSHDGLANQIEVSSRDAVESHDSLRLHRERSQSGSGREADNRAALTLPYPADPNRRLAVSD